MDGQGVPVVIQAGDDLLSSQKLKADWRLPGKARSHCKSC